MFILLYGYPPFDGKSDTKILNNIMNKNLSFSEKKSNKISFAAKKLLIKMLRKNPEQRVGLTEAYQDPWIQKNSGTTPLNGKVLQNLEKFLNLGKLRNILMNYIMNHICHKSTLKELLEAFKTLDKDGKGKISKEDLKLGYKAISNYNDIEVENQVDEIFEKLDGTKRKTELNFNGIYFFLIKNRIFIDGYEL